MRIMRMGAFQAPAGFSCQAEKQVLHGNHRLSMLRSTRCEGVELENRSAFALLRPCVDPRAASPPNAYSTWQVHAAPRQADRHHAAQDLQFTRTDRHSCSYFNMHPLTHSCAAVPSNTQILIDQPSLQGVFKLSIFSNMTKLSQVLELCTLQLESKTKCLN